MSTSSSSSSSKDTKKTPDNQHVVRAVPARTYPCPHCPQTFSTYMAMGGHQNAHRERHAEKRRIEPFMANNTMVESSFSTIPWEWRQLLEESHAMLKRRRMGVYIRPILSAPPSTHMDPFSSVPLPPPPTAYTAPPPPPVAPQQAAGTSTMLFGVPDFFRPSASTSGTVVALDDQEEDVEEEAKEDELDLDLKL